MFDKEAEEYLYDRLDPQAIDSVIEFSNKHIEEAIVSSFKDGAEFGYNKAKEEGKVVVEHFEAYGQCRDSRRIASLEAENAALKELVEKYRQAVDKCLHITFMGGGCEVNTIGQYATLVDGYLTDVEGLAKWKN